VIVDNIFVTYPNYEKTAISGVSLQIAAGDSSAIVGSSGAGKTTLADAILGIVIPNSGEVRVSGLPPVDAIEKWPGKMSYVPQSVYIVQIRLEEILR